MHPRVLQPLRLPYLHHPLTRLLRPPSPNPMPSAHILTCHPHPKPSLPPLPLPPPEYKVTLTTNRPPPPLGSIFEDALAAAPPGVAQALAGPPPPGAAGAGGAGGSSSVLSFQFHGGLGSVTVLVSKAGGRYRVQGDVLEGMWLIVQVGAGQGGGNHVRRQGSTETLVPVSCRRGGEGKGRGGQGEGATGRPGAEWVASYKAWNASDMRVGVCLGFRLPRSWGLDGAACLHTSVPLQQAEDNCAASR